MTNAYAIRRRLISDDHCAQSFQPRSARLQLRRAAGACTRQPTNAGSSMRYQYVERVAICSDRARNRSEIERKTGSMRQYLVFNLQRLSINRRRIYLGILLECRSRRLDAQTYDQTVLACAIGSYRQRVFHLRASTGQISSVPWGLPAQPLMSSAMGCLSKSRLQRTARFLGSKNFKVEDAHFDDRLHIHLVSLCSCTVPTTTC